MLERRPRRLRRAVGGVAAVHERGGFRGQDLLRLVQLGALKCCKPVDLIEGKLGEQLEEALHVGVFGVPPELPVVIRREHVGVEPHGARRRLAHLGARGGRQQRRGQPEQLHAFGAPAELDSGDDIAPLIRAAHL